MAYHYKLGGRARQRLRSDRLGARAAQASVSGPPRGLSPEGPRPGSLQWPLAGFASLRTLGLRAALSRGPLPEAALSAPRHGPLPRPCVSTEGPPKLARRASPSSAPHLGGGAPPHAPFTPGGSRSPARTRGWAGGLQRRERREVGAAEAASHSDATVPEQGGRDTPVRSRCRGCYGVRGLGCSAMKLECDQATFPVLPTYQHKLQNKILI